MNELFGWLTSSSGGKPAAYSFQKDGDEFRKWDLVAEYAHPEEALQDFPDFYVPYIHAAYPTRRSEDHPNANPEYLLRAIGKVNAESYIRARLSCYFTWSREYEKAFHEAVQYFLMTNKVPTDRPGDYTACIVLVSSLLAIHGFEQQSRQLSEFDVGAEFSEREAQDITRAVRALSDPRYRAMVEAGCQALAQAGYFCEDD